ncbi:MAG: hypothetical protein ABII26_04270 [Pseudomonadota bacterium]
MPTRLFQHLQLIHSLENLKPVNQRSLTNKINHIHITGGYLLVHLKHADYQERIPVRVYPEPCLGTDLTCRWQDEENRADLKLENHQSLHLIIDDGQSMILVPAVLQKISRGGFTVELPQTGYAVGQRQNRRYPSQGVLVEVAQSGFFATGELLDFSPVGFRISIRTDPARSFSWLNSDKLTNVSLRHGSQVLFSELCRCVRQQSLKGGMEIVMVPSDTEINRFRRSPLRNPRQRLVPSPTLLFDHPFLKKRVELEVSDISTAGFSIYETSDKGVLVPGMIIPGLIIKFAGDFRMTCLAQVVYRLKENEHGVRCGLAILDMDMGTYSRLADIMVNAQDPHAHVSSEVDLEELWEFFFDTGFIYPAKYQLIQSYRGELKETNRKLYQESPQIAKHFTYQKNGKIYSHLSMVRAYDRAWMIQHHASRSMEGKRTGFTVLRQIMYYLKDLYRFPSAQLDYVFSYFRPESKFPDRVFGGFTREIKDPKRCSMDLFSYLPLPILPPRNQLPEGWMLQESSDLDLQELRLFYQDHSDGLMLDTLDLKDKHASDKDLEDLYASAGLIRRWRAYSLHHNQDLSAVLVVNQSNLGFNMSDLLNCIMILVTDTVGLPWEILTTAINQLSGVYETEKVPILVYPSEYLEFKHPSDEIKRYLLWIYDTRIVSQFIEYLERKFKVSYWK